MPRFAALALCFFASVALTACGGDSHEGLMDETIEIMNDTATVLGTVTDVASAEEAIPELEALGEKLQALQKRGEELGEPDAEVGAELEKKYEARLMEAIGRIQEATMAATSKPGVAVALADAMKNFEM